MPQALPLTTRISQGSTRTTNFRVRSAQFGDGYSQEAPDGINSIVDSWSLSFENLNETERASMWSMFRYVGAWDYVTWTPPGDTEKKWKIIPNSVSEVPVSGSLYTISFEVKQVF